MNKKNLLWLLLFFLLFPLDPIPLNSDDFWVFNIVHDMVSNPTYYSLSGSGYRLMHKLIYLPVFAFFQFSVQKLAVVTTLLSALFSMALIILMYSFCTRIYGKTSGLLSAFLLGTAHAVYYTTWYWSGNHLIIGTVFLIAALYAYYFFENKWLWWSVFAGLSMFTRETFALPIILMTGYIITVNTERKRFLTMIPFLLFGLYLLLNKLFLGAFINPTFAGIVSFSLKNLFHKTYLLHLLQTGLLFLFLFCCALGTIIFLKQRKPFHIQHPLLLLWLLGHILTLLLTANADKRYLVPILPLLFMYTTKHAQSFLDERYTKNLFVFISALAVFWNLVFFSRTALTVFSPETWTLLLHLFLYGLFFFAIAKFRFSLKNSTSLIFIVLLLCTSIIQLTITYSFFVYQYDHTTVPNAALTYLAQHAPPASIIVTNKANSITTPDEYWFTAFGRPDLKKVEINEQFVSDNKTVLFWTTPTSKLEQDLTGAFVQKHPEYTRIAHFGGETKKYPLLKISASSEKRWKQFFNTGTIFTISPSQGYTVDLYTVQK